MASQPSARELQAAGWQRVLDPTYQRHYFWNTNTQEVTWERPCDVAAGGSSPEGSVEFAAEPEAAPAAADSVWDLTDCLEEEQGNEEAAVEDWHDDSASWEKKDTQEASHDDSASWEKRGGRSQGWEENGREQEDQSSWSNSKPSTAQTAWNSEQEDQSSWSNSTSTAQTTWNSEQQDQSSWSNSNTSTAQTAWNSETWQGMESEDTGECAVEENWSTETPAQAPQEQLSEEEEEPGQHLLGVRTRGMVEQWQNNNGWIRPTDKLPSHVLALLRKEPKGIYVNYRDISDGDKLDVGQQVMFWLVGDEGGLSAEEVTTASEKAAPDRTAPTAKKRAAPTAATSVNVAKFQRSW